MSKGLLSLIAFSAALVSCASLDKENYNGDDLADGFDFPVGDGSSKGYYVSQKFEENKHPGEHWNGKGGDNTDLGDPVVSIGHGTVIFAEDYKKGWGNVVLTRHNYIDQSGEKQTIDALYGHLQRIDVKVGDKVRRGDQLGTIGRGPKDMYEANLYFEIRKNLEIGMHRDQFPKTLEHYHSPTNFIKSQRPEISGKKEDAE